jgi:hypothetical protein
MRTITAVFECGRKIVTQINGTDEEIREYYLNQIFNLGFETDKMSKCIKVDIHS